MSRVAVWPLTAVALTGAVLSLATSSLGDDLTLALPLASYLLVGFVVARRRPENPIGWVFLSAAAVSGLVGLSHTLASHVDTPPHASPWWAVAGLWLYSWLWLLLIWMTTVLTFLLFPDGLSSRRWRPLLWLSVVVLVVACLAIATTPTLDDPAHVGGKFPNPLGVELPGWAQVSGAPLVIFLAIPVVVFILSVASLVLRSRRANGIERLQIRWFAFAGVVLVAVLVVTSVVPGLTDGVAGGLLFGLSVAFVPAACGVAILRYRLYDIDRLISRTASYAIVTGLLLLVYVLIVTSVSNVVGSTSTLAVAGATLATAALFQPLLRRVQRLVDRRFNREKVDGQRAVQEFGSRLTDEVDPEHAQTELLAVAHRMLQPATVSLWTVP